MGNDFNLNDYVPVSERIEAWYQQHPEGRIVSDPPKFHEVNGTTFVEVTTRVYRSDVDPVPCQASAWEPLPGKTPFTRDSEMMNAETAAIGRALAAAGIEVKRGMATREDVRNRQRPATASDAEVAELKGRLQAYDGDTRTAMAAWTKAGPRIETMTSDEITAAHLFCDAVDRERPFGDEGAEPTPIDKGKRAS